MFCSYSKIIPKCIGKAKGTKVAKIILKKKWEEANT